MSENTTEEKNKKINKMTVEELDKAIEKTKTSMGGLTSKYAKELLERKDFLNVAKK